MLLGQGVIAGWEVPFVQGLHEMGDPGRVESVEDPRSTLVQSCTGIADLPVTWNAACQFNLPSTMPETPCQKSISPGV